MPATPGNPGSRFVTAAGYYLTAGLLQRALPFLLLPVMTRFLSPRDYGYTALVTVVVTACMPLIDCGSIGAIGRRYVDRDRIDFEAFVFNVLLIVATGALLMALLMWALRGALEPAIGLSLSWLWLALGIAVSRNLVAVRLHVWQAAGNAGAAAALQIGASVVTSLLALALVVGLGFDWRGQVGAQAGGFFLVSLVALWSLWREPAVRPRPSRDATRAALRYGGPLVVHTLAAVMIAGTDRLFIAHYEGMEATGLYSIGYQFGFIIGITQDSFNRAWQPWFFARLKEGEGADMLQVVRRTYLYYGASLLAVGLLSLALPPLLDVMLAREYQGASVFIFWIALGYAFNGMAKMASGYLFFLGKTGWLAVITGTAAVLNALLNLWWVPEQGALGAARATAAAFLTTFLLYWWVAARAYPMPWFALRGRK